MQFTLNPEGERSEYPMMWTLYEGAVKIKQALLREAPVRVHPTIFTRTPTIVLGKREGYSKLGLGPQPSSELQPIILASADPDQLVRNRALPASEEDGEVDAEYIVTHDPNAQVSRVYVLAGEIDYTNLAASDPEDGVITAGQRLEVLESGVESISPIDPAELESLTASWDLEDMAPVEPDEVAQPPAEETEANDQVTARARIIGVGLFVLCSLACMGIVLAIVVGLALWRGRSAKRA